MCVCVCVCKSESDPDQLQLVWLREDDVQKVFMYMMEQVGIVGVFGIIKMT